MASIGELDVMDVADGIYEGTQEWVGMVHGDLTALTAAMFPITPPAAWFSNPRLTTPTPLTIEDDGRVFGHIATWGTSHVGMAGGVKPPRSRSRYAFFATGAVKTAEDSVVNVGQLTLTGGHAPLEASVAEAVQHYDDTSSAFADVAVGEDRTGIWVAGALRPDVDELKLRAIRASSVSGDWRPINGNLELIAVCAVNVPGFPIPRARVASGATLALVAAGTEELVRQAVLNKAGIDIDAEVRAGLETMNERLTRVEASLLDRVMSRRQAIEGDVRSKQVEKAIAAAAARKAKTVNDEPVLWEDDMPIEASVERAAIVAALRRKVANGNGNGNVVATATSTWTAEKRKKAAKSGAAMSDGSFPIADCTDVGKAVHAMGRSKHSVETVKAHIKKRAKALGCTKSLPEDWQ
jgi:hypothetical protein